MDTTMFQLRLFVHQRLYAAAAAEEILGQVEKTITLALHEAEVSRPKDEAESLRHQLPKTSAAELPLTNSAMEHGDKRDSPLLQENQECASPEQFNFTMSPEHPGLSNSSADLSSNNWNYCLVEMPQVKKEQEEHGDESETPEIYLSPPEIVKREKEQSETQILYEMQPLSSDSSAAVSDEEIVNSRGGERAEMVKQKEKVMQGKSVSDSEKGQAASSNEHCSVKAKKDRSFCHLCGKGFHYIAALMKHTKTHEKCTGCIICEMKYKYINNLVRHLKNNHSNACPCDVCGKTFFHFRSLQTHEKTHTGMKEFACQECGKTFHRRDSLILHVRTHSGEKPYQCDVCGKSFSQSQNLTIHKRSHSGKRPCQCGECGKLFSTGTQLKAHMRCHSGEKPYPCDICGKRFCRNPQMWRHRTTHTGERPYPCYLCGRQFRFAPNLKVHLQSHEKAASKAKAKQ